MRRLLRSLGPGALLGAFFLFSVGRAGDPPAGGRLVLLGVGALYGIAVVGLIRLFPVSSWALPIVGLAAGPVPQALFVDAGTSPGERVSLFVCTAVLGLLLGALEWAVLRVPQRRSSSGGPSSGRKSGGEGT